MNFAWPDRMMQTVEVSRNPIAQHSSAIFYPQIPTIPETITLPHAARQREQSAGMNFADAVGSTPCSSGS
jgi:hypothetical protein